MALDLKKVQLAKNENFVVEKQKMKNLLLWMKFVFEMAIDLRIFNVAEMKTKL